jgi:SAM-dependent methyltransferase
MNQDASEPALSFGGVADAYDRGRPGYPREAAAWLVGDAPVTVLELGAGTGKLTELLVGLGHDVHATDPDASMLAKLRERLPELRASQASAEEIPAGDRSYDVVVCAQAFHWFDHDRALPEIARVLKPGGRLALVWNERDQRVPWVRKLGAIIGSHDQLRDPVSVLEGSSLFAEVEDAQFRFRQQVDQVTIKDLVLSRSNVATLAPQQREAKLAEVAALYADYGRGMDGMQLPYMARCFRSQVLDRPASYSGTTETSSVPEETQPMRTSDGSETDMLLIDFR